MRELARSSLEPNQDSSRLWAKALHEIEEGAVASLVAVHSSAAQQLEHLSSGSASSHLATASSNRLAFDGRPTRRRRIAAWSSRSATGASHSILRTERSDTPANFATSRCLCPADRSNRTSCLFIWPDALGHRTPLVYPRRRPLPYRTGGTSRAHRRNPSPDASHLGRGAGSSPSDRRTLTGIRTATSGSRRPEWGRVLQPRTTAEPNEPPFRRAHSSLHVRTGAARDVPRYRIAGVHGVDGRAGFLADRRRLGRRDARRPVRGHMLRVDVRRAK